MAVKVEENTSKKKEVNGDSDEGEVDPVKEEGPYGSTDDTCNRWNNDGYDQYDGVGCIDAVVWVRCVFHAERNSDEISDSHHHPRKKHAGEEPISKCVPEVLH